jgi:hypothetical protein
VSAIEARTQTVRPRAPYPAIVRPRNAPRAATPSAVPEPAHHHLPAWVRRAHSQAAPILGDLLGSLDGEPRAQLAGSVDELVQLISSGKFSAAWRYPEVIRQGQTLYDRQAKDRLVQERERRALDGVRRKASELLRDADVSLPADVLTRLNRELRAAADHAAVNEVSSQIRQAISAARAVQERRREREIDRTRARIDRAPSRSARGAQPTDPGDSWQDVLAKLKRDMAREEAQS